MLHKKFCALNHLEKNCFTMVNIFDEDAGVAVNLLTDIVTLEGWANIVYSSPPNI